MALLAEQPMHGQQIIQELTERLAASAAEPRSAYLTSSSSRTRSSSARQRPSRASGVYELTDVVVSSSRDDGARMLADENDEALVALRDLARHQVLAATRQVAQAGSAAQLEAAQAVLRDARRSLYRLLAEDDVAQADE